MTERLQAYCDIPGAHTSHNGDRTRQDTLRLIRLTFLTSWNLVRLLRTVLQNLLFRFTNGFELQPYRIL